MIYFDNAATGGVKPENVVGAAAAAMRACANPGRSGHALSLACAARVQKVRGMLCEFFGAPSADRVIFTKNCTEALNIALLGCIKEGDKVVTTVAEHNSVLRPLKHLEGLGVVVRYAPLTRSGDIDIRTLSAMAQGACAVVVTLASNVTGAAPDIAAVRRAIPADALLICDGAQACGHQKIDISALGIDALAVAGHKGMMGIQGSGALIMSARCHPRPLMFGGTGSASYDLDMPDFYPDRLVDLCHFVEVTPAVDQVETHLFQQQAKAHEIMKKYGVQHESWGPFAEGRKDFFKTPALVEIGEAHGKSAAQAALRFLIQSGVVVIPKSTHRERMAQNIDVFDFALTDEEMKRLRALDEGESLFFSHYDPETVEFIIGLAK